VVNKSKQLGTSFESAVVNYLVEHGFPFARRLTQSGSKDKGDIYLGDAPPGGQVTVEAKNCAKINLAGFVDEAVVETENAGNDFGVAIIKRRGKNVRDAYVVTPLHLWVKDRIRLAAQ
jgi:hypothetical protein